MHHALTEEDITTKWIISKKISFPG